MSFDGLLQKAKEERLSEKEIADVVNQIRQFRTGDDEEDLYTLIYALGMNFVSERTGETGKAEPYREDIEKFLDYSDDPSIPCIALKTLCSYWGYTKDYLLELKEFVRGVEWDRDGEVRLVAIGISGEYLRETKNSDKELLQLLLEKWGDYQEKKTPAIFGEAIYESLARAAGQEWNELLKDQKPNPEILSKIEEIYQNL